MRPPPPECRLGGPCDLVTRDSLFGYNVRDGVGIAQCVRCSHVYEATGWQPRYCDHCHLFWGESLHDPCLGTIPGVKAACCGHGGLMERYNVPEGWPEKRG
jgi:hypothetical protein